MELPSKMLEQIAVSTGPKILEKMLIVMDKSAHKEHLSQPLQTNNKQFKIAITFLTSSNGIIIVTNNKFYFAKPISDEDGFIQVKIPIGAYEIENFNNEIKGIIVDEGHFTEAKCPFTIMLKLSTVRSPVEISEQGAVITSVPDDSIGSFLGFKKTTIYGEYNLLPNPVDILTFDNVFLVFDNADGIIFGGKRSGIFHDWFGR